MEQFLSYCFFVGYSTTDGFLPARTLTGTTFGTTNATSMPGAKFIKRYRDRLYLGYCDITGTAYPYRVYFSSVPSAGAITWTVASDFIDVDYSEIITGLAENWDRLLVFTEFSAYMYNQAEKKKVWDVGCGNHRSIQNIGSNMIWANKDNVWTSSGGQPTPIVSSIRELIQTSSPGGWRSAVVDSEYHLYLGSCSANGLSYANCLASFDFYSSMWRWRELYDGLTSMCKYTSSGDDFLLLGCSDGEIMIKSKYTDATKYYSDDGAPILGHFRTAALSLDDPSVEKKIKEITAYSEFGIGLELRYRIFNKNQEIKMPFTYIGNLNKIINTFKVNKLSGNFIQFEGKEYSTKQAFEFFGITIDYE
jgi:hypothetical protein